MFVKHLATSIATFIIVAGGVAAGLRLSRSR